MNKWENRFLLSFIILALSLPNVEFAVDDGPIAWWRFDEGKGRIGLDSIAPRRRCHFAGLRVVKTKG